MTFDQWFPIVAASASYVVVVSIWFCGAFIAFRRKPQVGTTIIGSGFLLLAGERLLDAAGPLALSNLVVRGRLPEDELLLYYQTLGYSLMVLKIASAALLVTGIARVWWVMDHALPAAPTEPDRM